MSWADSKIHDEVLRLENKTMTEEEELPSRQRTRDQIFRESEKATANLDDWERFWSSVKLRDESPADCGLDPRQNAGLVAPRTTPSGIEYVTHKMIVAHHGEEWAEKWSKAAGDGNTMVVVEEDGKKVGGTYFHDYERFARVVNYGTPTYFD